MRFIITAQDQISLNIEVTNSLFIPTSRTTNYGLKRTKVIGIPYHGTSGR